MRRFAWLRFWKKTQRELRPGEGASHPIGEPDRRKALYVLAALAGGGALGATPKPVSAQDAGSLPPKRALTGRDAEGKSVFKSFDVTPKVITIDANPGLTFHELYRTEGVPQLTGLEPDPCWAARATFPARVEPCSA